MIHKRRATPFLEKGGDSATVASAENGERAPGAGGPSLSRLGFPAREASSRSDGGSGRSGRGRGRGSSSRRQGGGGGGGGEIESPSSCASSAAKGKRRRESPAGSMYASRSFWFRVLCVAGGSFLLMMTAARRQALPWSPRHRGVAIVAAAVQEAGTRTAADADAELQERRLKMAMKYKSFGTTPHTLKDLLELKSDVSRRPGSDERFADVTAILVASSSLEAQLNALLSGSTQPAQVWVVMPAVGAAGHKATTTRYQGRGQFGDRLYVVQSDLFSDLPSGMSPTDSRRGGGGGGGGGGGDDGSFFNEKMGLFQLALQAATKFIWVIDPGVLPGPKFLHLLAHVSMVKELTGVYGSEGALMPAAPTRAWRSTRGDEPPPPEEAAEALPFALWDTASSRPHPPAEAKSQDQAQVAAEAATAEAEAASLAGRGAMGVGGAAGSGSGASVLSPVDVLFSQWFLDKDLVRLLFRERWLAPGGSGGGGGGGDPTGLALSYSVRRYAGVPTYVLPADPGLPEYSVDTMPTSAFASSSAGAAASDLPGGAATYSGKGGGGGRREKKSFGRRHNKNKKPSDRSSLPPGSRRLASGPAAVGGNLDGEPATTAAGAGGVGSPSASASAAAAAAAASSLARRVNDPALRAQFRELSARAGQFFWTPEQCPKELVLLVVDGRRQAELLEPLYRELVDGVRAGDAGEGPGGAEVFVAVIMQGPDESEEDGNGSGSGSGGTHLEPAGRRAARHDCTQVAEALGANNNSMNNSGRLRRGGEGLGAGRGHFSTWLGGNAQGADEQKSRGCLSPEEFCLGDAFGVFHVRAGQDYRQALGRPLDPYLEVFHGLSEVLEVARPKIVAYIAAPPRTPNGTGSGGEGTNAGKKGRAGMDAMLAAASSTGYDDPEDTVVRAVEAAVRSAGGGADAPARPIGVGLPPAAAGAEAAKALAYLPHGCLEFWRKPAVTLVLVHAGGEDGGLLSQTLRALSGAHYLGDRVELRLVLSAGDASVPGINQVVRDFEWEWGDLDVTYYSDGDGDGDGDRLPAGLAALEAFPNPTVHDHVIPLFSGALPDPQFYVWLKVALVNEGYAPWPVAGLPFVSRGLKRSLGVRPWQQEGAAGHRGGSGGGEEGDGGASPGGRGARRRKTRAADSRKMWGKFLALSVDVSQGQGLCPPGGWDGGCSRVWMYGSEAWGALRERCRAGLAADAEAGGGRRRRQGELELEPLEAACAVGDVAGRKGSEWGLEARRVCGAGPRDGGGGEGWERASVWEVYPLQ